MSNTKKSIKQVIVLISILFLLAVVEIVKIVLVDSETMITNSYNTRINAVDNSVKRGDILDINGELMAYSQKEGDSYVRKYVNGKNSAHVLGYTGVGKGGIEATQNFTLQKVHNEVKQRIATFFNSEENEVEGNSIALTIDSNLQKIGTEALGTNKGAIVVMEVKTGRILAMVSKPNYEPETVVENWNSLRQQENSPLLNRSTQGVYTPGSIFKIVTTTAALRNIDNIDEITFNCTGERDFEGSVIRCSNKTAHGEVNLLSAFSKSCNGYFAEIALMMGADAIIKTAEELGFNKEIVFDLSTSNSTVLMEKDAAVNEITETAMGQGRTTVTPLFMAMIAAAIGNNGIMMEPYLVDKVIDYEGNTISTTIPKLMSTPFTLAETQRLKELMVDVVNNGTGFNGQSQQFQIGGKTGTAQNPAGSDHNWFIGFAPAQEPEYAVTVILENADGSANASKVAKTMLESIALP
ncbi:MAG: peptidoglycan D,D-transpeptidase FtsI family protein [Anaerotignaceae bacterium]